MKCNLLNIKKCLIIKVPLILELEPFFYIKVSKEDNSYRVSLNYDHLNKLYGIKFNFIRNFNKIKTKNNSIFTIDNDVAKIVPNIEMSNDIYNIVKEDFSAKALGSELTESCKTTNKCYITKFIFTNKFDPKDISTLFVFKRVYGRENNYSMLFSSYKYFQIDDFLETIL